MTPGSWLPGWACSPASPAGPCSGVLPWRGGLGLDLEDSLALDAAGPAGRSRVRQRLRQGNDILRVSVIRTPRISNFTDVDALAAEPGVLVRFAASPAELADADLVVLPGTRATVADLGLAAGAGAGGRRSPSGPGAGSRCWASAAATRCWPAEIDDPVESGAGVVAGLGLLPVRVTFGADKVLGRPQRHRLRRRGARDTRSTTAWPRSRRGAGNPSPAAAGPWPCGARPGTGRWRATSSGGPS